MALIGTHEDGVRATRFACPLCGATAEYDTRNLGSRQVLCDGKPRIDNWVKRAPRRRSR